ncbi:MAG TPA: HDOD domain-containing protein [Burkholderiaceae bacterium]|nr:HDOD domain-containing protein [Burkholderiaceae bacterium]
MTSDAAPSTAPLRLEWLANPLRRPAALGLRIGAQSAEAWATLLTDPALRELCGALPCGLALDAGLTLDEASQALAADAGLKALSEAQVVRAPNEFPPQIEADHWVSGAWYLQAPAKAAAAQAASRARALQLVQLVSADADTHEIEAVLRQDATLSYHLLRVVNSVALGGRREITSFAQAILLLGRQQLRRWLHLMLFAARDDDPRSPMLGAHVTLRARSMELLAEAHGMDRAAQELAFMAGMFSLLGNLFGQPLPQVLTTLTLPDDLRNALLQREGTLGQLLNAVESAEAPGDGHALAAWLAALGVPTASFNHLRLQAALWTLQMTQGPAP